ncbi:hypothetical protein ACH4F6_27100 [Streptomyces sp. NPDC017936]|uniref:hypothetical protein n=1 Tax=Streptomyces sp. NPDC017936 TaxID=3365016 RepID=UPI0037B268BC
MFNCTKPIKSAPVACPHCGADVPQTPGSGRRKLYCTPDAGKLYRQRLRALGFPV